MNKTIIFDEPFESKLKELRIKTRFVKNVKKHCKRYDYSLQDWIKRMNRCTTWYDFVYVAFTLCETPEGRTYWRHIANL